MTLFALQKRLVKLKVLRIKSSQSITGEQGIINKLLAVEASFYMGDNYMVEKGEWWYTME